MEQTKFSNKQIGELVATDYRKAEVFKEFGLDSCCGGGKTVESACLDNNIDLQELNAALIEAENSNVEPDQDFDTWELDKLVDYIMEKHHTYVAENIPLLSEYTQKVSEVHGESNPEVKEIARYFQNIAEELGMHMHKEEMILFPYIKKLAEAKREGTEMSPPPFGTIANPVQMMHNEHDAAGEVLKHIHELSGNFTPPDHACNTYRVCYAKLQEFEDDLHQHIHLENNILFTKAIALEQELLGR